MSLKQDYASFIQNKEFKFLEHFRIVAIIEGKKMYQCLVTRESFDSHFYETEEIELIFGGGCKDQNLEFFYSTEYLENESKLVIGVEINFKFKATTMPIVERFSFEFDIIDNQIPRQNKMQTSKKEKRKMIEEEKPCKKVRFNLQVEKISELKIQVPCQLQNQIIEIDSDEEEECEKKSLEKITQIIEIDSEEEDSEKKPLEKITQIIEIDSEEEDSEKKPLEKKDRYNNWTECVDYLLGFKGFNIPFGTRDGYIEISAEPVYPPDFHKLPITEIHFGHEWIKLLPKKFPENLQKLNLLLSHFRKSRLPYLPDTLTSIKLSGYALQVPNIPLNLVEFYVNGIEQDLGMVGLYTSNYKL
jgi:hypothetical protein